MSRPERMQRGQGHQHKSATLEATGFDDVVTWLATTCKRDALKPGLQTAHARVLTGSFELEAHFFESELQDYLDLIEDSQCLDRGRNNSNRKGSPASSAIHFTGGVDSGRWAAAQLWGVQC